MLPIDEAPRTALCIEERDGLLYVFLPPVTRLEDALELLSVRASLLGATKLLDQVALDRYSFLRDAYLARRRDAVYDGAAPMESFEDDAADPPAKPASAPATAPK